MTEEIWKFPFEVEGRFELPMPIGADILKAEAQNGTPCMWAMVDAGGKEEFRKFMIVGTGQKLPDDLPVTYVDTFQHPPFVWHLFERI